MNPHEDFKQTNLRLLPAPGTEDKVRPILCWTDGNRVISKWQLSEEEVAEVVKTKTLYIEQWASPDAQPPILGHIFSPFTEYENPYAFCYCLYDAGEDDKRGVSMLIQNNGDYSIPSVIEINGTVYYFTSARSAGDRFVPLEQGMYFFEMCNDHETNKRIEMAEASFMELFHQGHFTEEDRINFLRDLPYRAKNVAGLFRQKAAGKRELIC